MFEAVNVLSNVAVYLQIENEIQFAIASGQLKAGDKLPSVRDLSEQIKVNPNTVAKAYRDLEVLGYIYTRRGLGVFVESGIEDKCQEECRAKIFGRLHQVVSEARAAGVPQKALKECLSVSYGLDVGPYEQTPAEVTNLAKPPKK